MDVQLKDQQRNLRYLVPAKAPEPSQPESQNLDWYQITPEDVSAAAVAKKELEEDLIHKQQVMPREVREKIRLEKLAKYTSVTVRIKFPDRTELEGTFRPTELMQDLFTFVKEHLSSNVTQFQLYTTPPTKYLDPECPTNFRDLQFFPKVLVYLETEEPVDRYVADIVYAKQQSKW